MQPTVLPYFYILLLTGLLMLPGAPAVHGQLYKWRDSQGKVHFSDTLDTVPPASRHTVEEKNSPPVRPTPTAPTTTQAAPAPGGYKIPLHRERGGLFVDVLFNHTVTARLLLDTGATDTVLSPQVAQQLRLDTQNADIIPVMTANGPTLVAALQIASMSVGKATAYNVEVSVHPTGQPGGLLGMSFLNNFQFSIQKDHLVLTPYTTRAGEVPSESLSESWWRGRFRFYRQVLNDIDAYLKSQQITAADRARLEKSQGFFQQKLADLERKASFASVPRHWRY